MASYGPLKQSLGMLHPAANRHPKATHQWLLMGRLKGSFFAFQGQTHLAASQA